MGTNINSKTTIIKKIIFAGISGGILVSSVLFFQNCSEQGFNVEDVSSQSANSTMIELQLNGSEGRSQDDKKDSDVVCPSIGSESKDVLVCNYLSDGTPNKKYIYSLNVSTGEYILSTGKIKILNYDNTPEYPKLFKFDPPSKSTCHGTVNFSDAVKKSTNKEVKLRQKHLFFLVLSSFIKFYQQLPECDEFKEVINFLENNEYHSVKATSNGLLDKFDSTYFISTLLSEESPLNNSEKYNQCFMKNGKPREDLELTICPESSLPTNNRPSVHLDKFKRRVGGVLKILMKYELDSEEVVNKTVTDYLNRKEMSFAALNEEWDSESEEPNPLNVDVIANEDTIFTYYNLILSSFIQSKLPAVKTIPYETSIPQDDNDDEETDNDTPVDVDEDNIVADPNVQNAPGLTLKSSWPKNEATGVSLLLKNYKDSTLAPKGGVVLEFDKEVVAGTGKIGFCRKDLKNTKKNCPAFLKGKSFNVKSKKVKFDGNKVYLNISTKFTAKKTFYFKIDDGAIRSKDKGSDGNYFYYHGFENGKEWKFTTK